MEDMKKAGSIDEQDLGDLQVPSTIQQPSSPGFMPVNGRTSEPRGPMSVEKDLENVQKPKTMRKPQERKRKENSSARAKSASAEPIKRARLARSERTCKFANVRSNDLSQAFTATKTVPATPSILPELNEKFKSKAGNPVRTANLRTDDVSIGLGDHDQPVQPILADTEPTCKPASERMHGYESDRSNIHPDVGMLAYPGFQRSDGSHLNHDANLKVLDQCGKANFAKEQAEPTEDYIRFMKLDHVNKAGLGTNPSTVRRDSNENFAEQARQGNAVSSRISHAAVSDGPDLARRRHTSQVPAEQINNLQHADNTADVAVAREPKRAENCGCDALEDFLPGSPADDYEDDDDEFYFDLDGLLCDPSLEETVDSAQKKFIERVPGKAPSTSNDPFADDDLDAALIDVGSTTPKKKYGQSPPFTQRTPTAPKLQWMPPILYTPPQSSTRPLPLISMTSPTTLSGKTSPLSERAINVLSHIVPTKDDRPVPFIRPKLPTLNVPTHIVPTKDSRPVPFARPKFPTPLLPRSPIPGLSPTTVLRTCFRMGEALNAATVALRHSIDAIIELYCRVKYSDRQANGHKQFFELVDIFTPDRSPSISGQYAIWKNVDLWEHDSRQFLGEGGRGKKARVVGRIKRGPKNIGWELVILSIWEVDWEDVGIAKGIVCS